MFDARIDKQTKVMYHDEETGKFFPRVQPEEHYTMTDGDGKYFHHFTKHGKVEEKVIPGHNIVREAEAKSVVQSDLDKKPAEIVSIQLMEWIKKHGVSSIKYHCYLSHGSY